MTATATDLVTAQHRHHFLTQGFTVFTRALDAELLALANEVCTRAVARIEAEMDAAGKDVLHLNHRGSRYFVNNSTERDPRINRLLFGSVLAQVVEATIGGTAHLFFEQFVVKAAEQGKAFGWHQDSGYILHPHRPYVTCWIALDDMSLANGTIQVLPYDRIGIRSVVEHVMDEATNDKVGYFGDDPGVAVECPAGSIVAFSSLLFHRSGMNTAGRRRAAYVCQYSPEPIRRPDGSLRQRAIPFLADGQLLASAAALAGD